MTVETNASQAPEFHPLVDSMARASDLNELFAMPLQYPDEGRWLDAQSLFHQSLFHQSGFHQTLVNKNDQRLREAVIAYGRARWGTENRHVAGSGFIVAYLTRLTYPLISQYVLHRRIPDVSLGNLAFHTNDNGFDATALKKPRFAALPDDPASGHPDALIVADEAALYAQLKEWLFDCNFGIVIPSIHRAAQASLKVSWNAVASSSAQVFHRLFDLAVDPESVVRKAEAFFDDPSSPVYKQVTMDFIEHQGKLGYFARRHGCCLWWRVEQTKGYCAGCILLSREEQDIRFRDSLEIGR